MDEIELKFLDINVEEIKKKLERLGAELKYDATIESNTFLKDGFSRRDSSKNYLRLRKINGKSELTFKGPAKVSSMAIRDELEIEVSDFDSCIKILDKLGFKKGELLKKHRAHYELGNIHFELDTLDNIPTFLEIETRTKEEMENICLKLGLDIKSGKKGMIIEILPDKFN